MIYHKVKNSTKHIAALVCVTAAGDLLPHYLVISQKLNQEFYSLGLVMGKLAVVVENRSPYIGQQLFTDDINRVSYRSYERCA
jgi:hypothetical protein